MAAKKSRAPAKARDGATKAASRPAGGTRIAGRPTPRATEDEVLATAHALGAALYRVGAVNAATIRDFDALCLPPRSDYGSAEVRPSWRQHG